MWKMSRKIELYNESFKTLRLESMYRYDYARSYNFNTDMQLVTSLSCSEQYQRHRVNYLRATKRQQNFFSNAPPDSGGLPQAQLRPRPRLSTSLHVIRADSDPQQCHGTGRNHVRQWTAPCRARDERGKFGDIPVLQERDRRTLVGDVLSSRARGLDTHTQGLQPHFTSLRIPYDEDGYALLLSCARGLHYQRW